MMDKKSIAMLFAVSCFASSAFAGGIVSKIMVKQNAAMSSIAKTHNNTYKPHRSYTDFSGTWMVNCGNGASMSTVIENTANYITLDGEEYRIGQGLQGASESNEEYVRYEHNSFEWNTDGSALTMKNVSVYKDNMDNSPLQTEMGTFTLTMKNGQINLDGKFTLLDDIAQVEPIALHCVFSRRQ